MLSPPFLALLLVASVGLVPAVEGATITVCQSGCIYTTIAAGVAASNVSDTVQISGTFVETTPLSISLANLALQFNNVQVLYKGNGAWLRSLAPLAAVYLYGSLTLTGGGFDVQAGAQIAQVGTLEIINVNTTANVINLAGVYTNYASLVITNTSAIATDSALIKLTGASATWNQLREANLTARGATAVRIVGLSKWQQQAPCYINVSSPNTSNIWAVDITDQGGWVQSNQASSPDITIVTKGPEVSGGVRFANLTGNVAQMGVMQLQLDSSGPGVLLGGGTWNQNGSLQIASSTATGVSLAGGTWQQYGDFDFIGQNATAVSGVGGAWAQRGNTRLTLPGRAVGASLQRGTVWTQEGALNVTASRNSYGVLVGAYGTWRTQNTTDIELTTSTGVTLSAVSAVWEQKDSVTIKVGQQATGVLNSYGGLWQQEGLTTIMTSSSDAVGIACSRLGACCAQIQQALSSTPSTLTFIRTAGSQDDCGTSPTPSPLASVAPVVLNTTAAFDESKPTIALSGTSASAASSSSLNVSVQLSLGGLALGDTETPLDQLNVTRTVSNTTVVDPNNANASTTVSTFAYLTQINDVTSLVQAYTYYAQAKAFSFAGINFTAPAGSVKWSLNFTIDSSATTNNETAAAQRGGFTVRYRLADLVPQSASASSGNIYRRDNTPQTGMTTFLLTLSSGKAVAQLEMLNVALVDGAVSPLASVSLAFESGNNGSTPTTATNGTYVLELRFGPFNRSVIYDPSLGLGVLLGRSEGGGGSSSSDTGLIVGVAVAIPVAVVLVVVVIAAGVVIAWYRKKRAQAITDHAVNFEPDEDDDHL